MQMKVRACESIGHSARLTRTDLLEDEDPETQACGGFLAFKNSSLTVDGIGD
jgi:hypothetical protein